jgi:putative two-component system response regulator
MHYNFIRVTTRGDVADQMRDEIASSARRAADELAGGAAGFQDPEAAARIRTILRANLPPGCSALTVDREWRPRVHAVAHGEAQPPSLPQEIPVAWESLPDAEGSRTGLLRGILSTPSGPHLAVACALQNSGGYVLVHRPESDVTAAIAPFLRSLPAIGGITLLWTVVLLGVCIHLILARHRETIDRERARSKSDMLRQTQSLVRTRDAVILALAKLAGVRDDETGTHLERISAYSTLLAAAARDCPRFTKQISPAFVRLIGFSSVLHDIGKVGIADRVLRKPDRLTDEERREMQKHTVLAGDFLGDVAQHLGGSNFLEMAREIAVAHHERWDGTGYPFGLSGEAIPLSARIVAIADTYDALSSKRVYKAGIAHDECVAIIRESAGTHLDPELVRVWLTIETSFREIALRYADALEEAEKQTGEVSRFVPDTQAAAASAPTPAPPVTEVLSTPTEAQS